MNKPFSIDNFHQVLFHTNHSEQAICEFTGISRDDFIRLSSGEIAPDSDIARMVYHAIGKMPSSAARANYSRIRQVILDFLRSHSEGGLGIIADTTGVSRSSARRILRILTDEGIVIQIVKRSNRSIFRLAP